MDGSGRRNRGGETWAAARAAYLDGQSAGEVCARFGLGLSALRARARRDGWRRMDQPDPDPDLEEDIDEELEEQAADFEIMAERAARLASRALQLGDGPAADRWLRLLLRLKPLAYRQHQATLPSRCVKMPRTPDGRRSGRREPPEPPETPPERRPMCTQCTQCTLIWSAHPTRPRLPAS